MADNELLIKINADAKNAVKAFDDVKAQTEDLEKVASTVAKVGAVAFAALTAEVVFSVKAFGDAEKASNALTQSLQNQGIYTNDLKAEYKSYAAEVQRLTGLDDDAVVASQAIAQGYLGQTKITQALTSAIGDLATKYGGDLNSAATVIAKTIGTSSNALAREGLVLSDTATRAERYEKVLAFVQTRYGGLAEAENKGLGGIKGLQSAFGDFQETIGEKFAPIIVAATSSLTDLFTALAGHDEFAQIAVGVIAAGIAVGGFLTVAAVVVPAFTAIQAAAVATGISLNVAFFGIPLIIGAVVGAITLLALNWEKSVLTIRSLTSDLISFLGPAILGVANTIIGALTFDTSRIQAGFDLFVSGFKAAQDNLVVIAEETAVDLNKIDGVQNQEKKKLADEQVAIQREKEISIRAIRAQEVELLRLQTENASAAQIELKTKEIANLKALSEEKSRTEIELLNAQRAQILALEDEQRAQDIERQSEFFLLMAESRGELEENAFVVTNELRAAQTEALRAQVLTEADIERKVLLDTVKEKINGRNKELEDRKKYGVAVAAINQILASSEVQGVKNATSELVALQNSRNSTLKAIGKAAAIAQVIIKTAESAINIYNGFSTIPIIGPALGVAGAAAAIAYGGEQISKITGAASGGLIEGGIPGRDSVPAMLMPGELVVPRKNFQDVVGAVQGSENNDAMLAILERIEEKTGAGGNTYIQGDILAEETYIDKLVRGVSDAIEFRNAKVYGLNYGV